MEIIDNQPFKVIYKRRYKAVKFTATRYLGKIRGKPGLLSCSTIVRMSHWNANHHTVNGSGLSSGHIQDTDPVVEITSGHRTISGQLLHVYGQSSWHTAAMSGQRWMREPAADEPSASGPPMKKRAVSKHIAEKAKEFDKMLNTSVWLRFEVADRDHVVLLSCAVCSQFQSKLVGMRNYRASFPHWWDCTCNFMCQ